MQTKIVFTFIISNLIWSSYHLPLYPHSPKSSFFFTLLQPHILRPSHLLNTSLSLFTVSSHHHQHVGLLLSVLPLYPCVHHHHYHHHLFSVPIHSYQLTHSFSLTSPLPYFGFALLRSILLNKEKDRGYFFQIGFILIFYTLGIWTVIWIWDVKQK